MSQHMALFDIQNLQSFYEVEPYQGPPQYNGTHSPVNWMSLLWWPTSLAVIYKNKLAQTLGAAPTANAYLVWCGEVE